jgi:uncharacterized membrane protein (DUF485 family)
MPTGPDPAPGDDHSLTPAERHNRRLGLILFFVYLLLYVAFVAVCAIDYRLMALKVVWGVNLAVVWGMVLIFAAFALALVYLQLAKPDDRSTS